ncbi:adenylate/guanylate cyclase domain-containing protein [Adhaeretor mobilis]|uniref:Adenylate cyclase 1 n=1 Tax=Adhaeretor mobilis TaxID=1930276 RepID=A0A517MXV1_9BACT|nr:adenylate/guanylate cyclase domain-containing protein [Adhaeretor mobilis]QDS99708.1 Adenylate cyclase 1 [Adhaeretor mobilis]
MSTTTDHASEGELAEPPKFAPPVFVYHHRQRILATVLDTSLEIGRQREGEPEAVVRVEHSDNARLIVTPIDDVEVSRSHVLLRPLDDASVEITNLSGTLSVLISPHTTLQPGEKAPATIPVLVQFGEYAVRVDPPEDEDALDFEGLPERTVAPGKSAPVNEVTLLNEGATLDEASLLRWLETVLNVFQSAASSQDFPEQAAAAVVRIVRLDTAAMIRFQDDRWFIDALKSNVVGTNGEGTAESDWAPSQTLLSRVRTERRTFRHVPNMGSDTPRSLQDVTALVAAPILNGEGNVIGALYGDRRGTTVAGGVPDISPFEAKLVELLATGIAAGLARLKEEQAAIAARVQFEQFFTPQLAEQLERDPKLLEGRDADVTVLFADIRGFSRISEQLGPEKTMQLIQETMGALSECVLDHDGVLVDYIGDELMAMWGAPVPQPNHATLACQAARQMGEALQGVNENWQELLGEKIKIGVGLNSGIARVGNTGSRQKFKYGPLGGTVNLASRVQGASKYLGADCLVTSSTLETLPEGVIARRLGRVNVVNIKQPIDLFQLIAHPPEDWDVRCQRYEQALGALENELIDDAMALVNVLALDYPEDRAIASLARRVEDAASAGHHGNTSIWQLPGK